jgi:uncharacterized membrane protein YeiH
MNHFPLLPFSLFLLLDFLGVFAGALGGGLEAMRNEKYDYDFVGVLGLAMTSALGGGITRDVLLQNGPPLAFLDVRYLPTALAGALIALTLRGHIGPRTRKAIIWIDAAAVGFFAVAGSTRAIDAKMAVLPAVILGAITAVGGGALRDVLSGRTPRVFESGQPYAIAAVFASAVFLLGNSLGLARTTSTTLGLIAGGGVRALALRFNLKTQSMRDNVPSGF